MLKYSQIYYNDCFDDGKSICFKVYILIKSLTTVEIFNSGIDRSRIVIRYVFWNSNDDSVGHRSLKGPPGSKKIFFVKNIHVDIYT